MKVGKQVHQLVEMGVIHVNHKFEYAEQPLVVAFFPNGTTENIAAEMQADGTALYDLPEGASFASYGVPDSHERHNTGDSTKNGEDYDTAYFVDYKSGKDKETWDNVKLAGDLKMKLTAFLVWHHTGKPSKVVGSIEHIPVVWNPVSRTIEPTDEESTVVATCEYSAQEMASFEHILRATVVEINAAYLEYGNSSDEFVNQDDVSEFGTLDKQRIEIEARQAILRERIAEQLEMGKKDTLSTPYGTFSFTTRKKYVYPEQLTVNGSGMILTLAQADAITEGAAAAKKKWETENKPESVTRSFMFRPKK